jgi:hypothetical protein
MHNSDCLQESLALGREYQMLLETRSFDVTTNSEMQPQYEYLLTRFFHLMSRWE